MDGTASVHLPGLWMLLSSMDLMSRICADAALRMKVAWTRSSACIVGTKPAAEAAAPRPMHPCNIMDPGDVVKDRCRETVFDIVDCTNSIELQWATLTFLAIDPAAREAVAEQSPPAVAMLTRSIAALVSAYLLGTDCVSAMTPQEAVFDFMQRLHIAHNNVA